MPYAAAAATFIVVLGEKLAESSEFAAIVFTKVAQIVHKITTKNIGLIMVKYGNNTSNTDNRVIHTSTTTINNHYGQVEKEQEETQEQYLKRVKKHFQSKALEMLTA